MGRPITPIQPVDPVLVVDERTPAVLRTPILVDPATGEPLHGRSATIALVVRADATAAPIHSTLEWAGIDLGDGSYTVTIPPRFLYQRLAPHANKRIYGRVSLPGFPPVFSAYLVAWRAATYPVDR